MSTRDLSCGLFYLTNAISFRTGALVKTDFRTCITDIATSIPLHETGTVLRQQPPEFRILVRARSMEGAIATNRKVETIHF
jgi:hypothetical protein